MTLSVTQAGSKLLVVSTADSKTRVDDARALAKLAKDACQETVMKCFKDVQTQIDAAKKARHNAEDKLKTATEKHQADVKQLKERIAGLQSQAKELNAEIDGISAACAIHVNSSSHVSQLITQATIQLNDPFAAIRDALMAKRGYV